MQKSIFEPYVAKAHIFKKDRDILRPSYIPSELPHRDREIGQLASILATALKGERPSNTLLFRKTGTGKTAVIKYLGVEFDKLKRGESFIAIDEGEDSEDHESDKRAQNVDYIYINCEIVDTNYGILAHVGNRFIDEWAERIPFTGWPTETVYSKVQETIDQEKRVVVLILDEIDKLVYKSGDDVLYYLLKLNDDLRNTKISLIGISNDLKFTEFLDPRVRSRLGEEKMVFSPYNADQLRDILEQRAMLAFEENVISKSVIGLCAALAAQEHGDARRALDLLRVSGELAERKRATTITEKFVYKAKNKIELDCIQEVIRTLPLQSKLLMLGIVINEEQGMEKMTTGEAYDTYKGLCKKIGTSPLTQRRITDLISELDMLGIINVRLISKGRYGRTREISLSVSQVEARNVLEEDESLQGLDAPLKRGQTTII